MTFAVDWALKTNDLSACVCQLLFFNLFCFPLDDPFRESWVRLQQLQGQRYLFLQVFRAVVIRRTLTWNTRFVAFVHDHSSACVYIHTGVGHTDSESAHFRLVEKLTIFSWAADGVRTRVIDVIASLSPTLYQLIDPRRHTKSLYCRWERILRCVLSSAESWWSVVV